MNEHQKRRRLVRFRLPNVHDVAGMRPIGHVRQVGRWPGLALRFGLLSESKPGPSERQNKHDAASQVWKCHGRPVSKGAGGQRLVKLACSYHPKARAATGLFGRFSPQPATAYGFAPQRPKPGYYYYIALRGAICRRLAGPPCHRLLPKWQVRGATGTLVQITYQCSLIAKSAGLMPSRQQLLDHVAVHVGQAVVAALEAVASAACGRSRAGAGSWPAGRGRGPCPRRRRSPARRSRRGV